MQRRWMLSGIAAAALFLSQPASAQLPDQKLGNVHFATSCAPAAQAEFDKAMLYQHSFWYRASQRAFGEVLKADPDCAIAYWGIALSLLWNPHTTPPAKKIGETCPKCGTGELVKREDPTESKEETRMTSARVKTCVLGLAMGLAFAGGTPLFYLVQGSAALVLLLAANTSFNGFPRLAAVMAEENWFPHQFTRRGMRLAYSNGIITIGVLGALLIIAFGGSTHALIPLFAVGVFLCFTLSQAGMVRHWMRGRKRGWRWRAAVNGTGAVVTGVVTIIVVATKFTGGAWFVIVIVPFLVLNFHGIHAHYTMAEKQLALDHRDPVPSSGRRGLRVVVPAAHCDRATARAIDQARAISDDVTVVHFATGETHEETLRKWRAWSGGDVKVAVVRSPYREVVGPLVELLNRWHRRHPGARMVVVLPEVIPRHFWERPLHNQMAFAIKLGVRRLPNIVVKTVPTHLER